MLKIEKADIYGWEAAIRGMRNPMNSCDKSDTNFTLIINCKTGENDMSVCVGENDLKLMRTLAKAGSDHSKFLRMIIVTCDITAPLYWWKEFDTYKVGTVANSCSTMHKIGEKEFTLDDFSCEKLEPQWIKSLQRTIKDLNYARYMFDVNKEKHFWWQMIQLLPTSYNQRRTVQMNYEVLRNMYFARKDHKLDEWIAFCDWAEKLSSFKDIFLED